MNNLEKLIKVVHEEHARSLLKLYTKIIEYKEFLEKQGYDGDVNELIAALIDSINNIMEV